MIRYLIHRPTTDGKVYALIAGLSTDAKPTAGLITGSRFVAADTGTRYMFDETAGEWNEWTSPDSDVDESIGIVVNGNKAALSAAIGQFVVLKNSTISGCADGLYLAAKAIPANTAIDSTYLTAVTGGGLNEIKNRIMYGETSTPSDHTHYVDISRSSYNYIIACIKSNAHYTICAYPLNGSAFRVIVRLADGSLPPNPVEITFALFK